MKWLGAEAYDTYCSIRPKTEEKNILDPTMPDSCFFTIAG
jgi:hypothetical protein